MGVNQLYEKKTVLGREEGGISARRFSGAGRETSLYHIANSFRKSISSREGGKRGRLSDECSWKVPVLIQERGGK